MMHQKLTRAASGWWAAWSKGAAAAVLLAVAASGWAAQAPGPDWWAAIDRDDASAVIGLLLQEVDPQARNELGNPALTQAVRDQSWKVFDALRAAPGVRLDEPNAHDETALMYLCILGQTERAQALIAAGAQVNRLGWTPLHYAASRGRAQTARMLIAHGAIINAPGPDGTTPLMMAALSGSAQMVDLLLSHGADPTMVNLQHETAADWARRGNAAALAARLDEAAARVAAGRGQDGAPAGTGPQPAVVPPVAGGTTPGAAAPAPADESSFSRYFDLGRFEGPDKP